MKICIIFLVLLVLFLVLVNCPKVDSFTPELTTPKIIKVIKESSNAIVEWYHDNTDIKDYVLLYVDVEKLGSGVWVQNNVKCKTKKCRIVLKNLAGNRYKLAVLSRFKNKLSDLEPSDIITFSGDAPFEGLAVKDSGKTDLVAEGDNEPLPYLPVNNNENSPGITKTNSSIINSNNKNSNNKTKDEAGPGPGPGPSPGPAPALLLDCTGGYVKIHNIKKKKELEEAKMKPDCVELENLTPYMKKPFYHQMLDKIF